MPKQLVQQQSQDGIKILKRTNYFIPARLMSTCHRIINDLSQQSVEAGSGHIVLQAVGISLPSKDQFLSTVECNLLATGVNRSNKFFESAHNICYTASLGQPIIPPVRNETSIKVGEVGNEVEGTVVLYTSSRMKDGAYGAIYLHRFYDEDDNELVWFTGRQFQNGKYHLKGRVKEHIKHTRFTETKLSHCRLIKVENVKN